MKKNYNERHSGIPSVPCAKWFKSLIVVLALALQGTVALAQNQGTASRVTLNAKDVVITEIFQSIKTQTDYSVVYNVSDVNPARKVTIAANNEPLNSVLDKLFAGTNVVYTLKDKHIVLSLKEQPKGAKVTASGKVIDTKGEALIGATVIIPGTNTGVATDLDGFFSLQAAKGDVLEVSYAGYNKTTVTVTGDAAMKIVLTEDMIMVGEVVVTAMGIKKEAKALTYNAQEIGGAATTKVKDASFIGSLAGKVAGAEINQSASGIGGSTRVVLRGAKTLFGNNDVLYVVDGIPMASLKSNQVNSGFESPDGGDGDGIADLNPEDIESMTVLTGAAGSALYGGLGANGVILVTTKKGHDGAIKVALSNNTLFMSPFVMPEFQNKYGSEPGSFYSWSQPVANPTYEPKDFFQTGFQSISAATVSTGNEKSQSFISLASTNARGLIPNNEYNKYNVSFNNTTELVPSKLTFGIKVNYIKQDNQNQVTQGQYHNPLIPIYLFPRGDDINKYKVYERFNPARNFATQFWPYGEGDFAMENPYWTVNREWFQVNRDRFFGTATLSYKITDWMDVVGRFNYDFATKKYQRKISASSSTLFASDTGDYLLSNYKYENMYADVLVNINKKLNEDFNFEAHVGGSYKDNRMSVAGYEGHLANAPSKFVLDNIDRTHAEAGPFQENSHGQIQSVYGTAEVSYKSMIYATVTARNDWSSALAFTEKVGLFYPSFGLTGVISEMVDLSAAKISFLKVRGSYAEVGNPPSLYLTRTAYGFSGTMINTTPSMPATGLVPERTKAWEAGLELRMFNNKVNFNGTAYKTNTYNQLFNIPLPSSSGYSNYPINAGNVENKGIELKLEYKDKFFGDLQWTSTLTYAINRNKIIELVPDDAVNPITGDPLGITEFTPSEFGTYKMVLQEGGTMGDIYVKQALKLDFNGYVKVNPTTGGVYADDSNGGEGTWLYAGSATPKYNIGWGNTFTYKNVGVNFLFSARVGGVGVSATQALMDRYGVSKATGDARDNGGALVNGGRTDAEPYYAVVGGGQTGQLSEYVYDATNVRLREASVTYNLPTKWFNNKLEAVSVSLIGRNLWMLYNKAPYDPEITASTGTYYQGFDYFMQPSMRSVGFSVNIQF